MLVDQLNLYNKAIVIFDERIKKVFGRSAATQRGTRDEATDVNSDALPLGRG